MAFTKRGSDPNNVPGAPAAPAEARGSRATPGVVPQKTLTEEVFDLVPERLLRPEADAGYATYAQRQAASFRAAGGVNNYDQDKRLSERVAAYDHEEKTRVYEQTDQERDQHFDQVDRLTEAAGTIAEGVTELLADVVEADVTVAQAVGTLQALESRLDDLLYRRTMLERGIKRTELIRAHPHRYMDTVFQRWAQVGIQRPSL